MTYDNDVLNGEVGDSHINVVSFVQNLILSDYRLYFWFQSETAVTSVHRLWRRKRQLCSKNILLNLSSILVVTICVDH